ncbi:hypothetical protein CLHUN_14380 [Ruminiclostridium hungatei]|uniref:DUF350 domain-containing protein n=1 Tax=Ruminiclostridium hungatei TaxID=48256 RepID=A0A1V4SM35_RUMHU|nr:DUF350 domain-containing protein [Ruminiclostridium hungatei]OPX44884.1 hypothetical protein CLHUN_14380 [Ruminiclostridium hungatei]
MLEYLSFFLKDLSFSFIILTVGFILGWIIYNNIILRDVCLKEALFTRDNLAVWIEFIGAFVFPVLYLAGHGIKGAASDNIFVDLAVCLGYTIFYIAILTILRLCSKFIVNLIDASDAHGKICLNKEICEQKNVGAALFSVSLSVIFVNIIKFLDIINIINGNGLEILMKVMIFLVFMLLALVCYNLVLRRRTTLFKELFIDNNAAAGIGLLGFVFAVQTIISEVMSFYGMDFDLLTVAFVIAVSLIIFGILSVLFKLIFTNLVKVDIWKEIYEQDNVGAAIGQVALYVGIAAIIVNFIM